MDASFTQKNDAEEIACRAHRGHEGDRARTRSACVCSDPDGAVARWRGLASGTWSLVDKVESDGRRFIVARSVNKARDAARWPI